MVPFSARTGVTIRSSGRVSAVHWLMYRGCFRTRAAAIASVVLPIPGRAGQARRERQVARVDHQPARQELTQDRRPGRSSSGRSHPGELRWRVTPPTSRVLLTPGSVVGERPLIAMSACFVDGVESGPSHRSNIQSNAPARGRRVVHGRGTIPRSSDRLGTELPRRRPPGYARKPRPPRGQTSRLVRPARNPEFASHGSSPRDRPAPVLARLRARRAPPRSAVDHRRASSFQQRSGTRLISGLVFALPIAITFSIVYWLLITLQRFVLNPLARLTASTPGILPTLPGAREPARMVV